MKTAALYSLLGVTFVSGFIFSWCLNRVLSPRKKLSALGTPADGLLTIAYNESEHSGRPKTITVPWKAENVMLAQDYRVYLVRDHHTDVEITHDPAIPYVYSAAQMGRNNDAHFRIVDVEGGEAWETKLPVTEFLRTQGGE